MDVLARVTAGKFHANGTAGDAFSISVAGFDAIQIIISPTIIIPPFVFRPQIHGVF